MKSRIHEVLVRLHFDEPILPTHALAVARDEMGGKQFDVDHPRSAARLFEVAKINKKPADKKAETGR